MLIILSLVQEITELQVILPRLYIGECIFQLSVNPHHYLHDGHEETLDSLGLSGRTLHSQMVGQTNFSKLLAMPVSCFSILSLVVSTFLLLGLEPPQTLDLL